MDEDKRHFTTRTKRSPKMGRPEKDQWEQFAVILRDAGVETPNGVGLKLMFLKEQRPPAKERMKLLLTTRNPQGALPDVELLTRRLVREEKSFKDAGVASAIKVTRHICTEAFITNTENAENGAKTKVQERAVVMGEVAEEETSVLPVTPPKKPAREPSQKATMKMVVGKAPKPVTEVEPPPVEPSPVTEVEPPVVEPQPAGDTEQPVTEPKPLLVVTETEAPDMAKTIIKEPTPEVIAKTENILAELDKSSATNATVQKTALTTVLVETKPESAPSTPRGRDVPPPPRNPARMNSDEPPKTPKEFPKSKAVLDDSAEILGDSELEVISEPTPEPKPSRKSFTEESVKQQRISALGKADITPTSINQMREETPRGSSKPPAPEQPPPPAPVPLWEKEREPETPPLSPQPRYEERKPFAPLPPPKTRIEEPVVRERERLYADDPPVRERIHTTTGTSPWTIAALVAGAVVAVLFILFIGGWIGKTMGLSDGEAKAMAALPPALTRGKKPNTADLWLITGQSQGKASGTAKCWKPERFEDMYHQQHGTKPPDGLYVECTHSHSPISGEDKSGVCYNIEECVVINGASQ